MSDLPSNQLTRQWKLLRLLESSRRGCTIDELQRATDVVNRTIRRDLKVLQSIFDISEVVGENGTKRWEMQPLSQQLNFTYTDLISIIMSRRWLEPMAATPFFEGNLKVLNKIKGMLGEQGVLYCEKMNRLLQTTDFGSSDYTKRGRMIDSLLVAMEDRKRVLVVYQSMQATEPVEQELGPQGFVFHNGSLYVIAWSSRRQEIRNYKLDRITEVTVGDELQYAIPDDFNLQDWQQSAFGAYHSGNTEIHTVRIRFHRDASRYVQEGLWHNSQSFECMPDGSCILTIQVGDFSPVMKWVLSFGTNAFALEPQELVQQIEQEIQHMAQSYTQPKEIKS